jgi:YggT family protein
LGLARGFGLSLLQLVAGIFDLFTWVIIIRALLSWVSPDPYNPIVRTLTMVTEPVLRPLRRLVPPHRLGGIDLSPLLAILILQFVKNGILYSVGFGPRLLF